MWLRAEFAYNQFSRTIKQPIIFKSVFMFALQTRNISGSRISDMFLLSLSSIIC